MAIHRKHPYGYWTKKENVLADAKQFNSQSEWSRASGGAFASAKKNGWLDEACQCMTAGHKRSNYWTLERLQADAQQYRSPSEWKKANASAYATAGMKGWLERCCGHMTRIRRPEGFWTKESVLESARRYATVIAWSLGDGAAYDMSKRRHWYREATRHMVKTYSHGEYTIYCFLLQHDLPFEHQKRFDDLKDKAHLPYDFYLPDYKLVIEYQGRQHFKVSKSSMFRKDLVQIQRRDALKAEYAKKTGLYYLAIASQNSAKINATLLEKLRSIALEKGHPFALTQRELTQREQETLAHLGTWTKDAVIADAQKYARLKDWSSCGNAASQTAYKNGWIEEATSHMTPSQKPKGYWTKERVLEDAKQYKSKMEWFKASQSGWASAQAKGWLPEATAHMGTALRKRLRAA